MSYGMIGLIDAIDQASIPARGFKFETYAIARIKGSMLDELRAIDWVPRSVRAKAPHARAGRSPARRRSCTARPPTPSWPSTSTWSEDELQTTLGQLSFTGLVALDDLLAGGERDSAPPSRDTLADAGPGPLAAYEVTEVREQPGRRRSAPCPSGRRPSSASTTTRASRWRRSAPILGVTESRVCQIHTKAVLSLRVRLGRSRPRIGLAPPPATSPGCASAPSGAAPRECHVPSRPTAAPSPPPARRWPHRRAGRRPRRRSPAGAGLDPPRRRPTDRRSTHRVVDHVPPAGPPLRTGQPRARVRHRPGHAGARRRRPGWSRSQAWSPAAATSRSSTPTACARPCSYLDDISVVVGQHVEQGDAARHHRHAPALQRAAGRRLPRPRRAVRARPASASTSCRSTRRRARARTASAAAIRQLLGGSARPLLGAAGVRGRRQHRRRPATQLRGRWTTATISSASPSSTARSCTPCSARRSS